MNNWSRLTRQRRDGEAAARARAPRRAAERARQRARARARRPGTSTTSSTCAVRSPRTPWCARCRRASINTSSMYAPVSSRHLLLKTKLSSIRTTFIISKVYRIYLTFVLVKNCSCTVAKYLIFIQIKPTIAEQLIKHRTWRSVQGRRQTTGRRGRLPDHCRPPPRRRPFFLMKYLTVIDPHFKKI